MWQTRLHSLSSTQHTQIPASNGMFTVEKCVLFKIIVGHNLTLWFYIHVVPDTAFFHMFVALLFSVMCVRLKNGQPLRDDYRIKQKNDSLIIRGVTEMDAGNYTIVLTNRITKEEQRRFFQLLVNGMYSLFFPFFLSS